MRKRQKDGESDKRRETLHGCFFQNSYLQSGGVCTSCVLGGSVVVGVVIGDLCDLCVCVCVCVHTLCGGEIQ